jgi:hypothetical protein
VIDVGGLADNLLITGLQILGNKEQTRRKEEEDKAAIAAETAKQQAELTKALATEEAKGVQARKTAQRQSELDTLRDLRMSKMFEGMVLTPNGQIMPLVYDMSTQLPPDLPIVATKNKQGKYDYRPDFKRMVGPYANRDVVPIYRGNRGTGTKRDLNVTEGFGWELTAGYNQVGTFNPANDTITMFNKEQNMMMGNLTETVTPVVGGVAQPELSLSQAMDLSVKSRQPLFLSRQLTSAFTGRPIGAPTLSEVAGYKQPATTQTLPIVKNAKIGDTTYPILHADDFAKKVAEEDLDPRDVFHQPGAITVDSRLITQGMKKADIIALGGDVTISSTVHPRDKKVTRDLVDIYLPHAFTNAEGVQQDMLDNVTFAEGTEILNRMGLSYDDVVWQEYAVTTVNGKITVEDMISNNTPKGTEINRHLVLFETMEDGKKENREMRFFTKGQAEKFIRDNPSAKGEYVGLATMNSYTGDIKSVTDPTSRDVLLRFAQGTEEFRRHPNGVLESNATEAEKLVAISRQDATVNAISGTIQSTTGAAGETYRAKTEADHKHPLRLGNRQDGMLLSHRKSEQKAAALSTMHGKLAQPGVIEEIVESEQSDQYVLTLGPDIVNNTAAFLASLGANRDPELGMPLPQTNSVYKHIKDTYPLFFEIPGMEKYVIGVQRANIKKREDNATTGARGNSATASSSAGANADEDNALPGGPADSASPIVTLNIDKIPPKLSAFINSGEGYEGRLYSMLLGANVGEGQITQGAINQTTLDIQGMINVKRDLALLPTQITIPGTFDPATNTYFGDALRQEALPQSSQTRINALMKLDSTASGIRVDGKPLTMLDVMSDHINGLRDIQEADHLALANTLVNSVTSLQEGIDLVEPFIIAATQDANSMNPTMYYSPAVLDAMEARGIGEMFKTRRTEDKRLAELERLDGAVELAADAQKVLSGYIDPNNSNQYTSPTFVGNLELALDAAPAVFRGVTGALGNFLNTASGADIVRLYDQNIDSLLDELAADNPDMRIDSASDLGRTGRQKVKAILNDIAKEIDDAGNNEAKRQLAVRQLNIVTLVYKLSSVLQGGTGGRTISDNDVAIILQAMRQSPLSTADQQAAVVREIVKLAREIKVRAEHLSSTDPHKVAAYMYFTGLSAMTDQGVYHKELTASNVAARLTRPGRGPQVSEEQLAAIVANMRVQGGDNTSLADKPATPEELEKARQTLQR